MESQNVNLLVAVGAGLLSFVSPCVLPLVPIYIGYLGGTAVDEDKASRARTVIHSIAFVAGFGLVFVALGASVGLVGYVLYRYLPIVVRIGGLMLIVLGLHLTGVITIPFLYSDTRFQLK